MEVDFDKLPPEGRPVILVASNEQYAKLIPDIRWGLLFDALGSGGLWAKFVPWAMPVMAAPHLMDLVSDILRQKVAKKRLGAVGNHIPIPHLDPTAARERFRFDFGHPVDGGVYVINPCRPNQYLDPHIADERFAQEKMAAFVETMANLGAKTISLDADDSELTAVAAKANAARMLGISASWSESGELQRRVMMEFEQPRSAAVVPAHLTGWLDNDPLQKAVATTRLNHGTKRAKVSLTFGSTSLVSGAIEGVVKAVKGEAAASFKSIDKSSWSFEVEFWPIKD